LIIKVNSDHVKSDLRAGHRSAQQGMKHSGNRPSPLWQYNPRQMAVEL